MRRQLGWSRQTSAIASSRISRMYMARSRLWTFSTCVRLPRAEFFILTSYGDAWLLWDVGGRRTALFCRILMEAGLINGPTARNTRKGAGKGLLGLSLRIASDASGFQRGNPDYSLYIYTRGCPRSRQRSTPAMGGLWISNSINGDIQKRANATKPGKLRQRFFHGHKQRFDVIISRYGYCAEACIIK